jgi:hypothetical protein
MVVGSLLTISIFLKIVLFCVFYRVSIGLRCFNLRIMNPDLASVGFDNCHFCFNVLKLPLQSFSRQKKVTKLFLFFYSVTRSQN